MYIVTKEFKDSQDQDYLYKIGDMYPREGVEPDEERCKELTGKDNKQNQPLIKGIKNVKEN